MSVSNLVFQLELRRDEAATSMYGYDGKTTYTAYAYKPQTSNPQDPKAVLCKVPDVDSGSLPLAEDVVQKKYPTWMLGLDLSTSSEGLRTTTGGIFSFSEFSTLEAGVGFHPKVWAQPCFRASFTNPEHRPAAKGVSVPATSYGYGPKLSLGMWESEVEVMQGQLELEAGVQKVGRLVINGLEDHPEIHAYVFSLIGEHSPVFYRLAERSQLVYFPAYLLFVGSPEKQPPELLPLRVSLVTAY